MLWPEALIRLQEIDLEFQHINQRLTEIEAELNDQSKLMQAQKEGEHKKRVASEARKKQADLEFELTKVQNKLKATEQQLYGGGVTNARELQDLQAEQQSLKRRQAKLEDELLEAMVMQEEVAKESANAQNQLNQTQIECEQTRQQLMNEREQVKIHGKTLLTEAQKLKPLIPAKIMDSYHYLKDRTGGIPVARLKNGVCEMCGVEVLKPTQRKAQVGEEAYCEGCHRLLVIR